MSLIKASLMHVLCRSRAGSLGSVSEASSATGALGYWDPLAATGTGTIRTCKLSIPYSWALATPITDNMSTDYTVLGNTGTTGLPQRTSTLSPLDARKFEPTDPSQL